ncbi:hypothetical protein M409DRAFT_24393 [Zasmidium cellare ATCC 36951]|uniref:Uncharacterized protein n=1 Tax=Zasmidium cellare ATCC 36951 TaxID=1080233 RepID=A0A6A6CH86_ZASCE|nr:uncharacterized protein M409DRAFT_24393 [Zasmidium cellare ATCC 36951]KAF2165540.1 hypothetical protein M409DRAFT_24393 [Zasmidium cellare ATCC 36951]
MPWDIYSAESSPEFGVQYDWSNGISDLFYNITLYKWGCEYGETNNCTKACLDPQKLWSDEDSAYTLHNCNAYSVVAQLWHAGNLTEKGIEIATSFGISNDSSSQLFSGPAGITSCIDAYCDITAKGAKFCNGTGERPFLTYFNITNTTFQDFYFNYNPNLCNGLNAEVNPDIGGIGVFTSYIMQVGIVAITWVLFHIGHDWTFYTAWVFARVKKNNEKPLEIAKHAQEKVKDMKMFQALSRAITEFQKAQVWFMLAIAALIALNNQEYFEASTWQQQRNNLGIFYDLALGGCLPVLLIELILREAHKLEGYILIISVCCVALSASTWIVTSNVLNGYSPEDLTHNGPSACAGLVPTAVCYADDWFYKSSAASEGTGVAIVIFSLLVQACIILDKLRVFSHGNHGSRRNSFELVRDKVFGGAESQGKTQTLEASRNRLTRLRSSNSRKTAHIVGKLIIVAAEIALLCLTLRQLKDYARIFGAGKVDDYVAVNKTSWKLGQIIAVAVFVPPVVEYIWDCYRGIAKTVQKRMLPENMAIVRRQNANPSVRTATGRQASDPLDTSKSHVSLRSLTSAHVYQPLSQNQQP